MYSKRILVLQQTNGNFAEKNKEICGMVKLVNNLGSTNVSVFVTNANTKTFGKWWLLLDICGNCHALQLDTLTNFNTTLGDSLLESVSCLLVKQQDVCYEVARASVGDDSHCNGLASKMQQLIDSANGLDNGADTQSNGDDTQYEQFVVSTDNYYQGVDVNNLQSNANKRYQSIQDYSNAFDRFYASGGNSDYYTSVRGQITQVFIEFPPYYPLMEKYKQSFFVRIDFPNSDKYFVLGVLQEEGIVKYICYGLPAEKEGLVDKDFVLVECEPINFYMLFQNADSGQITVVKDNV